MNNYHIILTLTKSWSRANPKQQQIHPLIRRFSCWLLVVAIKRGNVAADDMKYGDGREETHSCRAPSLSCRSRSRSRSLSASFSLAAALAAEDTDNMQMEQRPMPLFTLVITEWEIRWQYRIRGSEIFRAPIGYRGR